MELWAASTMKPELPSLAAQNAFLAGGERWTGRARPSLAVEYGDEIAWFAVRTNPRCEDRALATLGAKGFEAFHPMGRKVIVHHRTRREIERSFPLLVGYVFLAMPAEPHRRHWGLVRECHGVKGVLGVDGLPVALPRAEVEALRLAEEEERLRFVASRRRGAQVSHSFVNGDTALIGAGPFSGFAGQVVDASSRKAIRILLSVFGGLTEVEVPVDALDLSA